MESSEWLDLQPISGQKADIRIYIRQQGDSKRVVEDLGVKASRRTTSR